jgi:hypothetical protein
MIPHRFGKQDRSIGMESTQESIRVGVVQRAVAFGLALLATSFLFTSVPVVFTAGASVTAAVAGA